MASVYPISGKRLSVWQILPYLVAALIVASVGVLIFRFVYNEPKFQELREEVAHYGSIDAYIPK